MAGDVKVAVWGNRHVSCEHIQAGNQSLLAQVTRRSLHKPNPPDFAPRLARDECIAFPPCRAERLVPLARFVEDQTTAGLVLRAEGNDGRFADQVWKIFFMARREAVVAARHDVVQFVQRVAARTPRLAFLVSDEQVSVPVESERVGHADACRDSFELLGCCGPLLNRAALTIELVMGNSILYPIRVRIVRRQQTEIDVAAWVDRYCCCVHTP